MKTLQYFSIIGMACVLSMVSFGIETSFVGPLEDAACFENPEFEFDYEFCAEDDSLDRFNTPINIDTTFTNPGNHYPLPSIVQEQVEYDPATNQYIITQTIGNSFFSNPKYLTLSEYLEYELEKSNNNFWQNQNTPGSIGSGTGSGNNSGLGNLLNTDELLPDLYVGGEMFDRLFGGSTVDIRPQGDVNLTFGGNWSSTDRPDIQQDLRENGNFDFDMDINMNMVGQIGDKMKMDFNYNTLSTFDFDNQIKLDYAGTEDEIIQKIEAGNVSFPLPTVLIPGAQSLFGLKTELKFGRLTITSVASQQRSQRKSITIQGGSQVQEFEVNAFDYEENRNFFLGHQFRNNFNRSLATLPYVNSPIDINRVEVWVTNDQRDVQDIRNVVAIMDLGESEPYNEGIQPNTSSIKYPNLDNFTNNLYDEIYTDVESRPLNEISNKLLGFGLSEGEDFITTYARRLDPNEYTFDRQLGYISLNISLQPDQIVGVSYEYTNINVPDTTFKVGEFAQDIPRNPEEPNVVFIKLLKTITQNSELPMWDLMMKNIYSLGAYQVEREDFKLDVIYQYPGQGDKRYLDTEDVSAKDKPIIQLVNLDNLNANNERDVCDVYDEEGNVTGEKITKGDGIFDYVEGITMKSQRGRLMFPVLEPFGASLRKNFKSKSEADTYAFDSLYTTTKTRALQEPEKNNFIIRGTQRSKLGTNIRLNTFNLPRGTAENPTVVVRQGGRTLREDVDYTVNYSLGTVQIINEALLQSGQAIDISFDNPELFGFNLKSMYGTRLDYMVNKDFNIGGTFMHLAERPFTQKVNFGDDPIANSMYGLDVNYFSEAPGITKFIDKIPFMDTKEKSSISFRAEAARFAPGHPRAITKQGQVFIDDFEGSTSFNDITFPITEWALASTPVGARSKSGEILFPEAERTNDLSYGYNRAKINWYQLENNAFCGSRNRVMGYDDLCTLNENRFVDFEEIFPDRGLPNGQTPIIRTFDISYYPNERGPYNYTTDLNANGTLPNPEDRWGGIMRALSRTSSTDFEASNTEFIEFWMMDPFFDNPTNSGSLYINLGEISEDILKDSNKFGEHAIDINEGSPTDTTAWGVVPLNQISPSFSLSTDEAERIKQDVGFDGANDSLEQILYKDYLDEIENSGLLPEVKQAIENDPSNDNYSHFRLEAQIGDKSRILDTYKKFNNPEGNSPINEGLDTIAASTGGIEELAQDRFITTWPFADQEDLNNDNTLNRAETYFEYRVDLKADMEPGETPFLVATSDIVTNEDGGNPTRWLNFQIPIEEYENKVGPISDFRAIRFIRLFLTDFEEPITCRFEGIDLVRNQWRKYNGSLKDPGEGIVTDSEGAYFTVNAVGVEEDRGRKPIPYVLPPNVVREQILSNFGNNVNQNEQAMAVEVCNLEDGDARAVFKTINFDFREFKRMKMLLHAHTSINSFENVKDGEVTAFIRIGSDFTQNFYEYEIPLKITTEEQVTFGVPADSLMIDDFQRRQSLIWPSANEVDFALEDLVNVKRNRNVKDKPIKKRYTERIVDRIVVTRDNRMDTIKRDTIYKSFISVVGSPDLGRVETIMLGVRNPENGYEFNPLNNNPDREDDAEPKCVEVWFNEFAVSEFDERDGYAAIATLDMKLADWGNLVLSGNMHTDGFGTLEQRVNERFKNTLFQYDGSLNLELGQFFPKESGIQIPFRADYSRSITDPEFDPYETDILFDDKVQDEYDKALIEEVTTRMPDVEADELLIPFVRDSIMNKFSPDEKATIEQISEAAKRKRRKEGRTVDEVKSINFTGVRKLKTNSERKQRIYDIENWTATYAFTESKYRDPFIEYENSKEHYGSLGYNYATSPKFITPFKKLIKSDSKWLSLIKDFNFNPIPNSISFNTDIRRRFEETKLRDLDKDKGVVVRPTFNNEFIWARTYGLNFKPTKSIAIDYNATNNAEIDEPCGCIEDEQLRRDSIFTSLRNLGRNIDFRQGASFNYKLPFDKLPLTDWIDAQVRYNTNFDWQVGPFFNVDTIKLGNFINNSQNMTLTGNLKLRNLYNKSEFLKQYDTSGRRSSPKRPKRKKKDDALAEGKPEEEAPQKVNSGPNKALAAILKPLMSIKQISLTYNDSRNTSIPGFLHSPQYLGQNWDMNAPGLDFVFGRQPNLNTWLPDISRKGWITSDTTQNEPVIQTQSQKIDLRATLEPFNDLKIDLTANMSYSNNHSEWFKKINKNGEFERINPMDLGSYSVSYIPVRTLFKKVDPERVSQTFLQFERNREIIGRRLTQLSGQNPNMDSFVSPYDSINADAYFKGYGPYQQDVLVPAFMAAYTGRDANTVKLNPLSYIPLPNWNLTYNGLTKLGNLKEFITNFSIKHGYQASYSVNSFQSELEFRGENNIFLNNGVFERPFWYAYNYNINDISGNYFSLYNIPAIVLTESFAPLIGIDLSLKNGLTTNIDYKKSRNLALGFSDYQLLENRTDALTVGFGYRFQDISIPLRIAGRDIKLENDLTFTLDFTYRNDITINYTLDQENTEPTQGALTYQFSPRLEYVVNDRLRASLFFDRRYTNPHIPDSYTNSNTQAGLQLTFTLAE